MPWVISYFVFAILRMQVSSRLWPLHTGIWDWPHLKNKPNNNNNNKKSELRNKSKLRLAVWKTTPPHPLTKITTQHGNGIGVFLVGVWWDKSENPLPSMFCCLLSDTDNGFCTLHWFNNGSHFTVTWSTLSTTLFSLVLPADPFRTHKDTPLKSSK